MIQIKRNNKVFFTLEDFGEGSKLSYQLMDHHYIILKFTTATPIYFEIGDSVEIPDFGYFELTSSYFPKHNDSDGYDYEMQMDAYYMSWKNKLCKYRPQHGANETSFSLTTTVGVHMNVILGNLKALGLTYNGKDFSVDYTTYNNKAFDVQKRFLIEYGSISILDALNAICSEDALNCEWWIDGSIIYLGYCEMEGQATFEQDVNVLSMSYSESKSTYITRLYAFGSDRNIPKGYFTGADADVTTDGVATDYLMLPNKEVDSDGFYAKNGYLENVNVVKNDKQAIEGVVMFEEEYPKVESVVSSIKTYDSTVDNEDGTKTTQTFWQVTSTDSFTNNFKESWIKSNLTLGIKFTSGALMGMEFDVSFKVIDKVNYFEIVANDTYGRTLPDGVMCPKVGDKYFLFNWDATKITDTDLIPTAQLSLFDRSKLYYQKTMISNSNFTCTMDGDKFYNDGTYDYHPLGEQVKLINDMFAQVDADGKHYRNSRIIGMEIPLDIPYDHPQYTVGEKAATSRLGKLEDKVDSIKVNGMQIGGTGSGNGGGVYVIGMNDTTPASDSNVYSARRSRMEFVSRLLDNTAKGTITWEKVQKFLGGLLVGNSNNENGGSWTPDAEGRSHLITDYLEVRMKAIFEELVINKTSTIGGKEIISPAGGVVAHKVEEVTVTYNNVSQKAYRCYFLAEQEGNAVDNDFAVGDQVRSESFNVRKGTYHKAGNHFYWRFVIGRDEDPVELEGKKYHYIDLSDTDCATASDVPAKGDVLNQCGNRTDVERQNCLIFSAVDTYSPSISLYHGINSYSFANREYVEYGVNKQNNKAFFNVYGDMYFGDRPTSANNYEGESYVKFDSETKKVTIKGDLDIKSTYDGKTLDKYIADKSLDKDAVETIINKSQTIIDLQNQIDGAIETWFYDGVPTLKNAPAISWKTDKDKETHLGDLYYDNKTGKAYRFAKDGSTYKWIIITDTELTKALKDSSQALKDAKSKRRIFGSQPVPPYDVNDMWVNATYPNDGSTYKNEILKCSTAKAEGEKFDIADWKLASKYTDDTKAEEAKKAAEKAQEEIKTTQSNLNALGTTVTENKKTFDSYVKDGYLEPSEIAAMAQDSKRLEDAFAAAEKSYNEVKGAEVLKSTKELTDLNTAFTTLSTAKTELVTYLSDISTNYNKADTNGKAAIVSAVGTKFTNFQSAYSAFYDKLGLANAYITSKIYGDLKQNITDLAGYKYLKDALGQTTYVDGGLVMTTLLALRDGDGNVQSGINGAIDKNRGKKSIATWWGGQMVDKDYNSGNLTPATSLIRFDGSGYLANGAIWWDVSGKVHADPTSFIISEKNLGAYLTFFEPTWKEGSAGTSVADLVSLKPNAPFSKLGVSGDATFEGAISFHGIKITYDATNKAIKIDGNLYATGGITAYGASSGAGGGGLNASVISYARILEGSYTDADLTSIPNAYAIKALSSRIDNIATELGGLNLSWNNITGKPSTFTPSAHTHKWTEITDRITKVSQLTNDKGYLTAHQSLASYYTKAEIDAKGYTTNKGTVTSVALTLPTGLTCATKTITTSGTFAISLASGYSIPTTAKQTAWDGAVSAKHTHSNKSVLDGITSTKVTRWDSAYDWYALITTDEETADGVINKWNEVVSFLANIAQTDTLSGIVDGINKSISDEVTRAKKAEGVNASGISTNKTSITTLQGYFTSGSAKKALQLTNTRKLWGNSFNGTADINGSIIVPDGKYISIGNIKMEYDATNKALKITNTTTNEVANLYTSGGVSAYGVGTSSSSGGGLNVSVKSYSNALKLTSESLSEIASAYSIKALDSRISSLEGGSATSIETTGSGNAVTSVSKSGTKITFTKGSTFSLNGHTHDFITVGANQTITATQYTNSRLSVRPYYNSGGPTIYGNILEVVSGNSGGGQLGMEWSGSQTKTDGTDTNVGKLYYRSKRDNKAGWTVWKRLAFAEELAWGNISGKPTSLSGYGITDGVNAVSVTGSGNAVTAASVSGHTLTLTKGATYLTSHQSLSNYYTKSSVDSLLNGKSATSHTHSVKINGVTKTIAATGGTAVDLGTYLTSHQSLADYAKKSEIPTKVSQLTNDTGYITSSGSCAYATSAGNADKVDGVHVTWAGEIVNTRWLAAWENDGSALRTINPANVSVGNADKLDGIHANGLLTALSNSNNGISLTVGGTIKNLNNIQVYSATKLVTSRNISIGGKDFVGNANFDGSGNIILNGAINHCTINIGSTDPNPYKRVAHIKVSNSWNDNALLLYINQGYSGGKFGLCRVDFRTNDIQNNDNAGGGVSIRWLIRSGYSTDSVQAGYYIHLKNAYVDVFVKTTGAYQGTVIRVIQDSRGSVNNYFSLINSSTDREAYTSLSAAAIKLYNIAYQGTVSGYDDGVVKYSNSTSNADMVDNCHVAKWNGLPIVDNAGVMEIGKYIDFHNTKEDSVDYSTRIVCTGVHKNIVYLPSVGGTLALTSDNVASATKLAAARTIWGQSFDGTGNVNGTIYINNSNSSNGAIRLNNDISANARISAIDDQVIFNTGAAIRFGETAWDWNQWAGLKYTHSNKTIYLGIADKSVFTANSAQSNGTLKFPCITTITPDGGARIGGSGGDLYLGNANNSNCVKVQDICSQVDSNNWKIMQGGYALFKDITIINTATINGSTHINNLLTAKGIMPTTTDVNAFGTNVNNWDGSIGANVTNMFNGIPQDNIQVEYSMDNGATWNAYFGNPENRFNLINDNARGFNYYLGSNNLLGDTEADKLAQIKKNQLRVTVKIPDEIYQELSWISVDVNNGVDIKCQVYFGSSTGGYKEYVSKIMKGWSHKCDICVGPNNVNVGNDSYRYVRLVFSHLNTHTALRNGIVAKIRALALTKYIYNGDRYTISTTGHIYDYDAYMNTYFPNSILAKGGVTAYQSSDIRLKQDLRKLDYLGIIKAMGGTYGFAWKKDNTRSIGWIAQHVLCNPHLKDIVETDEKGYYKINYWSPKLIATAFGAIEQVGDEVSRLKARVVFLESEVQRLSGDKEDCNKKRLDNKNINLLN